jgi:hypothetical protein
MNMSIFMVFKGSRVGHRCFCFKHIGLRNFEREVAVVNKQFLGLLERLERVPLYPCTESKRRPIHKRRELLV